MKSFKFKYNPNTAKKYLKRFKFYSLEERYLRYLRNEKLSRKQYEKFIDKQKKSLETMTTILKKKLYELETYNKS